MLQCCCFCVCVCVCVYVSKNNILTQLYTCSMTFARAIMYYYSTFHKHSLSSRLFFFMARFDYACLRLWRFSFQKEVAGWIWTTIFRSVVCFESFISIEDDDDLTNCAILGTRHSEIVCIFSLYSTRNIILYSFIRFMFTLSNNCGQYEVVLVSLVLCDGCGQGEFAVVYRYVSVFLFVSLSVWLSSAFGNFCVSWYCIVLIIRQYREII